MVKECEGEMEGSIEEEEEEVGVLIHEVETI